MCQICLFQNNVIKLLSALARALMPMGQVRRQRYIEKKSYLSQMSRRFFLLVITENAELNISSNLQSGVP